MAMAMAMATSAALQQAPSSALWISGEAGGLRSSAFASPQCRCGRASSALFGTPILRVQRQSRVLPQRGPVQPRAVKYEYKSSQNPSDISQAPLTSKSSLSLIKDARIEAQPPQDQKLRVRVDLSGKDTQRAFDTVVRSLAKNAPPVPGFRRAKGGKTSIVPTSVLLNMMGVARVRKFVIEEIVRTVLVEYVEKEGIKAKKSLATDKTADELNTIFEPGQDFGFDATLDLEEDSGDAEAKAEPAESEVVSAEGGFALTDATSRVNVRKLLQKKPVLQCARPLVPWVLEALGCNKFSRRGARKRQIYPQCLWDIHLRIRMVVPQPPSTVATRSSCSPITGMCSSPKAWSFGDNRLCMVKISFRLFYWNLHEWMGRNSLQRG